MGRAHKKQWIQCLYFDAQKYKSMHEIPQDGYTINELMNSTAGYFQNRQQDLTYLIHIREISFSKDTRFFTPSYTGRFRTSYKLQLLLLPYAIVQIVIP